MAQIPNEKVNGTNPGNRAGGANMPANNTTDRNAPLGTTHNSSFGKSGGPAGGPKVDSDANMPANNSSNVNYTLGTTKHAAGGNPSYMQNKK